MRHPEWSLQTKIKQFVREWCAEPHEFAAHDRSFDKTGKQHIFEAARGIRRAWPDTELALGAGRTFRCELKWAPNRVRDGDDQDVLLARLRSLGHPSAWADSVVGYLSAALDAGVAFRPGAEVRAAQLDAILRAAADAAPRAPGSKRARAPRAAPSAVRRVEALRRRVLF